MFWASKIGRATWLHFGRLLVVLAQVALSSELVAAHAPPKGASILKDEDGRVAVIVTNRGLIFRDPEAATFRLLCVEALGIDATQVPRVALLGGGRLLAGTRHGLLASDDGGCVWEPVAALAGTAVSDLVVAPGAGETIYATAFGNGGSGIHVSHDGGREFESLVALPETDLLNSIVVSPSDRTRIYAAGMDISGASVAPFLLRSMDGGGSWDRLPLPKQDLDYRLLVRAVDPANPDGILVSSEALSVLDDPSRLVRSTDAGDTFVQVLQDVNITDAGYHSDGRLWATSGNGLFESPSPQGGGELALVWDMAGASCGLADGDGLYVCGSYRKRELVVPGVGLRNAATKMAVDPWMLFTDVDMPLSCDPAGATHATCEAPWRDWTIEQLGVNWGTSNGNGSLPPDAAMGPYPDGPPDAGNERPGPAMDESRGRDDGSISRAQAAARPASCSCRVAGGVAGGGPVGSGDRGVTAPQAVGPEAPTSGRSAHALCLAGVAVLLCTRRRLCRRATERS